MNVRMNIKDRINYLLLKYKEPSPEYGLSEFADNYELYEALI